MRFTEGFCPACGEYSTDLKADSGLCRPCHNKRDHIYQKRVVRTTEERQKYWHRLCEETNERFVAWTERLSRIKTHSLTEAEWLEACRYFGGCALCNSDQIDARGYFIRFEDGGKYNACNVIPLCDVCATDIKYQSNPFKQMNPTINRNLATCRGLSLEKVERVAKYLQAIMEDRENEQQS